MTTTSIRPGGPFTTRSPFGEVEDLGEDQIAKLDRAFFEALDKALEAATGDPSIQFVPQLGEIYFECVGEGETPMSPVTKWKDTAPQTGEEWAEVWRGIEVWIEEGEVKAEPRKSRGGRR